MRRPVAGFLAGCFYLDGKVIYYNNLLRRRRLDAENQNDACDG